MSETLPKLVIEQVKPDMVGVVAPHILDLVEKACAFSNGRFDPSSVFENCAGMNAAHKWQLWVVFDRAAVAANKDDQGFGAHVKAVTVTSLNVYPTGQKVAETILIGGKGPSEEWLHYFDTLKAWAKANGASRIQFIGRRGWQRSMKTLGINWKPVATMFECDLEEADGSV
jgi:hypothetical protein